MKMTDTLTTPDLTERSCALDTAQSFIVQAPAGSGKTSLLIQRYLKLLACVDAPEEIVAITFTRKAAAEMRARILTALEAGRKAVIDREITSYEKLNYDLAQSALHCDQRAGWHILDNPERLRIQTIDSFCAALTRQMPILTKFGAQPEIIEDAADFYREAARSTLKMIEHDHAIAHDVERLLEYLDNDAARIETLLAEMLAKRDHWLRHTHGRTREELEAALQNSRGDAVRHVSQSLPAIDSNELLELLHYAAANLIAAGKSSQIICCEQLETLTAAHVEHWCGIAELLLTRSGDWRADISLKVGFPPGNNKIEKEAAKAWKNRLKALIDSLSAEETFQQALQMMRRLPPPDYSDKQWEILGAITRLLPYAVAQLKVVFQIYGKVDFSEIAQRALWALGDPESPTDLALALDYRIKHIMIDEFQDTSISQFKLLEKLVAGWNAGDGRSLFVVGDPMQSIYRFREAEVGLFLKARSMGVGDIVLQPITLRANFRSQQGIIDWVNEAFARIMPAREDFATGAVAYTGSQATHPALAGKAVEIHPFFDRDDIAEAQRIVEIIAQTRRDYPTDTIAILVRNRSHLKEIVPVIKNAGFRFHAVDIDLLRHKPAVHDLLILTRALINLADDIAWFSVLRAPWCGLLLADITMLASIRQKDSESGGIARKMTLWESIIDEQYWEGISIDAAARLRKLREILQPCINFRQRQPLRLTVEAAWQALGGPACIDAATQEEDPAASGLKDAEIYLDFLESQEEAGEVRDLAIFEKRLSNLYASPDFDAVDTLQIMTIHKAKGLEFDTVIVPGLGRKPRGSSKQLLRWMEQPHSESLDNENILMADLLLAPIQETGAPNDPIYTWMEGLDQNKQQLEADRLLYVAATRAKKFLHLMGHVDVAEDSDGSKPIIKEPGAGSLLNRLWPVVQPVYSQKVKNDDLLRESSSENQNNQASGEITSNTGDYYRCLRSDWLLPPAPDSVFWEKRFNNQPVQEEIEFSWAGELARHAGNVVHRWLQQIAEDRMQGWNNARIRAMRDQLKQNLLASGMSGDDKEFTLAVERVMSALNNAIIDPRGQWILGPQQFAQNELKITGIINSLPMNVVIDRTFCDPDGNRWIIDYKTSSHEGSNKEAFLDREQTRYQYQLQCYAKLLQQMDPRPVRLGLYFPLIGGWREW